MSYKTAILYAALAMVLQSCGGGSGGSPNQSEATAPDQQAGTGSTTENTTSTNSATVYGFWEVISADESPASYWQINEAGVLTTYDYLIDVTPLDGDNASDPAGNQWSVQYCYVEQSNEITTADNSTYQITGPLNQLSSYANDYELVLANGGESLTINAQYLDSELTLKRIDDITQKGHKGSG